MRNSRHTFASDMIRAGMRLPALMQRARRPPLQHPLAPVFDRAVDSLGAGLSPETTRHHRGTARNFLSYLGADHPEVQRLDQLRREPHILGWMSRLRSHSPPLATP